LGSLGSFSRRFELFGGVDWDDNPHPKFLN
jgi:hypothetical protein